MKELAELRVFLNKKVDELLEKKSVIEEEIQKYQEAIAQVDTVLVKKSFTTAAELYENQKDIPKKPEQFKPVPEQKTPTSVKIENQSDRHEIKTVNGTILGSMVIFPNYIQIIPSSTFDITGDEAPLKSFFLGKIMKKMQDADQQFSYQIKKRQDGFLENISIQNYKTSDNVTEISKTITWAFRKIHER